LYALATGQHSLVQQLAKAAAACFSLYHLPLVQAEKDEDELPIDPDLPTPEREVEGLFEKTLEMRFVTLQRYIPDAHIPIFCIVCDTQMLQIVAQLHFGLAFRADIDQHRHVLAHGMFLTQNLLTGFVSSSWI